MFVYILKSIKNDRYYIGSTKDIQKRLIKHNNGEVDSTKKFLPWILVFKQEYPDLSLARKVESRLKRFKRRDFIEKIVREGEIKITGG